jgi:hypothetical protein
MTTFFHRLAARKAWGYAATLVAGIAALCLLNDHSLDKLMSPTWAERICAGAAVISFLIAWFAKSPASRRSGEIDKGGPEAIVLRGGQEIQNRRGG